MRSGLYSLLAGGENTKTVLHVKLTDSIIEQLEKYMNTKEKTGVTLEFTENTGVLRLPSESGSFKFQLQDTKDYQNTQIVSRVNRNNHYEHVGHVVNELNRFGETDDTFSMVKVKQRFMDIKDEDQNKIERKRKHWDVNISNKVEKRRKKWC